MSAVAQLERDVIRERVRFGLRNARTKGKRMGLRIGANGVNFRHGKQERIKARKEEARQVPA